MKSNLIWSDEFDGHYNSRPDEKNWVAEIGGDGWGNQELQFYTASSENVFQDGCSSLVFRALEISNNTNKKFPAWYGPAKYTSARLVTKELFEFTYGRIEARLKIPTARGMWSALWLHGANYLKKPWPDCGEIDIMEFIGGKSNNIYGSLHGPGYSHLNQNQKTGIYLPTGDPNFHKDFHIYTLEWQPNRIKWFVDNHEFHCVTPNQIDGNKWVFDQPFFLVLNLAIGGEWAGIPNNVESFPQEMLVDYIRVYEDSYPKSIINVNKQLQHKKKDQPRYSPPVYNDPLIRGGILEKIVPKGGVCAEIGVHFGSNIETILNTTVPKKLHLIDPWYLIGKEWAWGEGNRSTIDALCELLENFEDELSEGKIELHIGFDLDVLETFADEYFDWIYLDTSHQYEQTVYELKVLQRKVKLNGVIVGDDWFPDPTHIHYGLFKAAQEFMANENYELIYGNIDNRQWAIRRRQI